MPDRDALDAAMDEFADLLGDHRGMERGEWKVALQAARAAMRKAAREMGEEQEVMEVWYEQGAKPVQVVALHGNDLDLAKGDRVRVVKVEP